MRITAIISFLIINVAYSENYPLKVKTLPDFPEGLPPTSIIYDGKEIGSTDPGKSIEVILSMSQERKSLFIGDDEIIFYLTPGNKIAPPDPQTRNWSLKKNTLILTKKFPDYQIQHNSREYYQKIKSTLNNPDADIKDKAVARKMLTSIMSYEYITEDIVVNLINTDAQNGVLLLDISYFGEPSINWQHELQVTENNFTKTGRPKELSKQVSKISDYFLKIKKYGVLKMDMNGSLVLNSIKTKKYKYGTKKGKKKALKKQKVTKKYILPIIINAPKNQTTSSIGEINQPAIKSTSENINSSPKKTNTPDPAPGLLNGGAGGKNK